MFKGVAGHVSIFLNPQLQSSLARIREWFRMIAMVVNSAIVRVTHIVSKKQDGTSAI